MFQTKAAEKVKTHILCSVTFFSFENRAGYEKMWKNFVERGRLLTAVWFMPISFYITKSYKHSGFGGLEIACWPLVPKFAGSYPAEAVGFLGRKKSSARLPSEGK